MFTFTTVCHHTSDCSGPLLLLTNREGNRSLFGKIPEGTQRVLNENGFRLGRLRNILYTGILSSWADVGGLPGLFLTISDSTNRGINLFANSSGVFAYVVATWRYFVYRRNCKVHVSDADALALLGDSTTEVFPVAIPSSRPQAPTNAKILLLLETLLGLMSTPPKKNGAAEYDTDIHLHVALPAPDTFVDVAAQTSVNYIIRFVPLRGKFDPVKAKALGVKPGIDFRTLTQGEPVKNDNGELVYPSQVLDKEKSFPKALILDIPNTSYLQNTLDCNAWFTEHGPESIGLVYHFLGADIDFELLQYANFILKFPKETVHVISHPKISDNTLVFRTHTVHLMKLKSLMNNNYTISDFVKHLPLEQHVKLQSLQQITVTPAGVTLNEDEVVDESWESLYDKLFAEQNSKELFENSPIVPLEKAQTTDLKSLVQTVTLGTGSAVPAIHRNVLANLLRIPFLEHGTVKYRSVLLDCGENTLGSLMRNFGHNEKEQFKQIMAELCVIYLSHLHADHHLGVLSVITAWMKENQDNDKKLYVVAPWQYKLFVTEWSKIALDFANIDESRIVHINCEHFKQNPASPWRQLSIENFDECYAAGEPLEKEQVQGLEPWPASEKGALLLSLGLADLQVVSAIHCPWSYSASFTFELSETENFKVSFSGDTRPNHNFVAIGKDSDLLIHEASLDNDLIEEAIEKKHTTILEAIKVGQLMNCSKVILTHFSARFSEKHSFIESQCKYEELAQALKAQLDKSPNIFQGGRPLGLEFDDMEICYASDFMNVRLDEIKLQKQHFAAITQLSQSEVTEILQNRDKRDQLRMEEKRETKRLKRLAQFKKKKPEA